ncbi:CD276 antigen isoform X2 [Latimeria chalumnae]|nr:PREDICTED: CD276 antigen-like [Latimeria chalumnae]|eukprot:XP_005998204.1 PREDICTED: CD276 antigen-like [Latimeria chalumnae]
MARLFRIIFFLHFSDAFELIQVNVGETWVINTTNPTKELLFKFKASEEDGTKNLFCYNRGRLTNFRDDGRISVTEEPPYVQISIRNITRTDEGVYWVKAVNGISDTILMKLSLIVTAPYSDPQLEISQDGKMIHGKCVSRGGYPEAKVMWQIGNGTEVINSNTTALKNSERLFDITSETMFNISQDSSFNITQNSKLCCIVSNPALHPNKMTCQYIMQILERSRIYILLPLLVFLSVAFLFLVEWKCRWQMAERSWN